MRNIRPTQTVVTPNQTYQDWTFGKPFLQNAEAARENLRTRLLTWRGECFFALQEGVDWPGLLGSAAIPEAQIREQIYTVCRKSDGVRKVLVIDVRNENRRLEIQVTVLIGSEVVQVDVR